MMALNKVSSVNEDVVGSLWKSIRPKSGFAQCQTDDEEILKISLLLQGTLELVTEMRKKQLSMNTQLNALSEELVSCKKRTELSESEREVLKKETVALKKAVQTAEAEAAKYQKVAEAASAKSDREFQAKVSSEVDSRLHAIFSSCLQQNRAASAAKVLDMMTQMYQDTQHPETECPGIEPPVVPRLAQMKSLLGHKKDSVSSPDVIPSTPEQRSVFRGQLMGFEPASAPVPSTPSSPDEVACTPPISSNFQKKDGRRRGENIMKVLNTQADHVHEDVKENVGRRRGENILKVLNTQADHVHEDVKENVIYAKDTQDLDETVRPVVQENLVVPPTFNSPSYELERENTERHDCLLNEKENYQNAVASASCQPITSADPPTAPFSQNRKETPSETRDRSPILGNSASKKISGLLSNSSTLGHSVTKNSSRHHARSSLHVKASSLEPDDVSESCQRSRPYAKSSSCKIPNTSEVDKASVSYHKGSNSKAKKSIQLSIRQFGATGKKSLSLKREKTDISTRPEFKGGQRSAKHLSINTSHLSENEQLKLALENSKADRSHNSILEDSDETRLPLYTPPSNKSNSFLSPREVIEDQENAATPLFRPNFASTAKEEVTPVKRKSPSYMQGHMDIGKPLCSSTEMDLTQNSALEQLAQYLDHSNFDGSAPYTPETSYDHLPKAAHSPNYAYQGPAVRNKNEREKLTSYTCKKCGEFFDTVYPDNQAEKKALTDRCTRHKCRHPVSLTPPDFWNPNVPNSQFIRERLNMPTT